jgi:hypothetical protein|tara:strand:- start:3337 stop:3495 length:159 start_codon:yes stop_codon:yes gene_type:complete
MGVDEGISVPEHAARATMADMETIWLKRYLYILQRMYLGLRFGCPSNIAAPP